MAFELLRGRFGMSILVKLSVQRCYCFYCSFSIRSL